MDLQPHIGAVSTHSTRAYSSWLPTSAALQIYRTLSPKVATLSNSRLEMTHKIGNKEAVYLCTRRYPTIIQDYHERSPDSIAWRNSVRLAPPPTPGASNRFALPPPSHEVLLLVTEPYWRRKVYCFHSLLTELNGDIRSTVFFSSNQAPFKVWFLLLKVEDTFFPL